MQNRGLATLLEYIRRTAPLSGPDAVSDGELLGRFIKTKDDAAFELLVRRHGPMVFGVARRMLRNEHSAEDVLQATFLAFARQAKSLQGNGNVAGWLYRVAVRISQRARSRSEFLPRQFSKPTDPATEVMAAELRSELDAAIDRLPEKLRVSVMHCYVSGYTTEEAARMLDCPKGTVLSRLAAAREKLQTELTRKGITVSAATLATVLTSELSSASLPATLVAIAMKAIGPAAALTPIVISLAQGVVAMSWMKTALVGVVAMSMGIGMMHGIAGPQAPQDPGKAAPLKGKVQIPVAKDDDQPPVIKEVAAFSDAVNELVRLRSNADSPLVKTLVQRAEAVQRELMLRIQEYSVGRGTLSVALDCANRAKDSSLELANDKSQELNILRRYLDVTKYIYNLNYARFQAGAIKQQDLEQSLYAMLTAQVLIFKAEAK